MYQVWADFCSNEGFRLCPQGFTGQDCTIECKTIKICDPITGCKKKFYWCAYLAAGGKLAAAATVVVLQPQNTKASARLKGL